MKKPGKMKPDEMPQDRIPVKAHSRAKRMPPPPPAPPSLGLSQVPGEMDDEAE